MKTTSKKLLFCFLFFQSAICLFIFAVSAGIITYSQTPSIAYGFFLKLPEKTEIKKGDLVIFDNPDPTQHSAKRLIKRVEKIEDGKCIVKGKTEEELFKETQIKGLRSYDSDFFGEIEIKKLRKVFPLITW